MPIPRHPRRALPAALLLAAALTGCSASASSPAATPAAASATTLPPVSADDTSPAAVAAANAQLSAEILTTPTGGRSWSGSDAHTGALTLDDFVNMFYTANPSDVRIRETGLAETRGFVTAAHQGWFTTLDASVNGSEGETLLIRFASAAGAQDMYRGMTEGWREDTSDGSVFTDDAVHGLGFAGSRPNGNHHFAVEATTVRGNTLCYVGYYAATADRTAAQDLLKRQVDALSGRG